MDVMWQRMEFVWTLSWLAHGCSVGTDGICLDVIMTGTWVLCGNGRSSSGCYHGWHMGALWERMEFVWTLSWLAYGCSVGTDGICLDVIMVGTWVLYGNGRSSSAHYHDWYMWVLCGNGRNLSGRYHGWHMDALWERTEFVWTLRQGRRFRQSKSSKYSKYQGFGGLHARAAAPPQNTREAERFQLQSPRSTANTDAVGLCAARVYSTSVPLTTIAGQRLDPWTPIFETKTLLLRIRENIKV